MSNKLPLTRKQFGSYITRTQGKGSRRENDERCPLTNAIRATFPKRKDGTANRRTVGSYDNLPKWAIEFMNVYDGTKQTAVQAARTVGIIK